MVTCRSMETVTGAKETALIDEYKDWLGLNRFDLLIDWG